MHYKPPLPSRTPQYSHRVIKPLPTQLLDHCTVCLEEQLYSQAFSILTNAFTSSRAHVPPPQYLGLAATLIVHPQFTTRTTAEDKHEASRDAYRYLRQAVRTLEGNPASGLRDAFRFEGRSARSDRSQRYNSRPSRTSAAVNGNETTHGQIRSPYADRQSLWKNSEDFWSVVGWAFNCSVLHKARWERWKLWLEPVLDAMENDLHACSVGRSDEGAELKKTLLVQYLLAIGEGRNSKRRVMRATLADGTAKMLAEFGEIWARETKMPKASADSLPAKRRKLDLENDEFGDYFDNDSDNDNSPVSDSRKSTLTPTVSSLRQSKNASPDLPDSDIEYSDDGQNDRTELPNSTSLSLDAFGGMDSIVLRQRLLSLLVHLSHLAPSIFLDTEELYDLFTEFLRPLPLNVFQQFALPTKPYLDTDFQISLNLMLFRPLTTSSGQGRFANSISIEQFETHFALCTAVNHKVNDNAKVSLLVESLLRRLWQSDLLSGRDMGLLREAIESGIEARSQKAAAADWRRKVGKDLREHESASAVLKCSAERIRIMMDLMSVDRV